MNGYEAIAKILKQEGVEWMACFPANPLIEAIAKEGIKPFVFRQERGGIMAADGFSRMMATEGKFGVFACQGGPGIENAFGGIAQASSEGVPIIFLPDGPGVGVTPTSPNFSGPDNFRFITKWAQSVTHAERIPGQMRQALSIMKNGRPGPVMLEMQRDVMGDEVSNLDDFRSPQRYVAAPDKSDLRAAVKKLLAAKKPVIWAGQGVLYAGAAAKLTELAELTQIPVITTMPGKSAIDERHPLSLGAANKSAPKGVWEWLKSSDVLLAIGASLTKTNFGINIPSGKTLIHSTANYDDIDKEYTTDIGLIGDANKTICMLIDEIKTEIGEEGRKSDSSTQEAVAEVKKEWMTDWAALLNSDMDPINPYRLVNEINKVVDHETTIVTHDAGHPRDQLMPFYTATVPHSYIGWGKSTHLGYGIPLMIGAKIAHPEKMCINFMGDAAFGMSGLDLETANRIGAPITTVLLNNGTMGGYNRALPTAMGEYNAGNMGGNYAGIAEDLGGVGIKITDPSEIGGALTKARQINNDEGKSVLLDVKTQQWLEFSEYKD
ncbi:MAG: thiamine pyrophosphate-requiring protein [Chloroflexi bacterium]|jgi:thiamine pyrophosphate-dependent acetolactate synthase large subunit-like protein|nr:thiamine pyrophosphate-requiring protein [Chloroflexota bacterium]MBT3864258.1 thiamine pyrophosphate-requiring protein [Chloroflexota bacterium]MBT4141649.1 thiamine pyrophosphate-requiring protein [Chloroflexota bacterium]MBT4943866.1 thiamine pyrophosphate-requiring protein [Chloroflexota bacterium]MBT6706756.1 thiamine pyrophosphate-requiring protein [Chloroflexota bacterium]